MPTDSRRRTYHGCNPEDPPNRPLARGDQAKFASVERHTMRVLLVLGYSFPTQQALWEEVARQDVDLHVAYTLDIPRDGAVGPPDFGTTHELTGVRVRGDRQTWMAYRGLSPLVKDLQPDLVHVLNEPWAVVVLQAIHARARHVVTHGAESLWDQGSPLEAMVRRHTTRRNLCRTSGFVSWNSEGVAWARRWGLPPASPTVVLSAELPRLDRFSHPEQRRAAGRERWGFDQEFVVGFVGRLVAQKGLAWLLESWRAAGLPDHARLVFVGQGPMDTAIRAAATADARIRLLGPVPFEQVPTVMASLDALGSAFTDHERQPRAVRARDHRSHGFRGTRDCQRLRRHSRSRRRRRDHRQRGIDGRARRHASTSGPRSGGPPRARGGRLGAGEDGLLTRDRG